MGAGIKLLIKIVIPCSDRRQRHLLHPEARPQSIRQQCARDRAQHQHGELQPGPRPAGGSQGPAGRHVVHQQDRETLHFGRSQVNSGITYDEPNCGNRKVCYSHKKTTEKEINKSQMHCKICSFAQTFKYPLCAKYIFS